MKTYTTGTVASWLLVAASGAMAAPSSADCGTTVRAQPLSQEAVIADLVASRQAPAAMPPHDGEWYNAPAPLEHMGQMGQRAHMAPHADTGVAPTGTGAVSADQGTGQVACLATPMR